MKKNLISARLVKCPNVGSTLINEFQLKSKSSAYVCAHRFTCSMATISMPVTIQRKEKSPVIEVESDNDAISPIHEILHDNEQSLAANDLITPSIKELIDNSLLNDLELKPLVVGISSPVCNLNKLNSSQSSDSSQDRNE